MNEQEQKFVDSINNKISEYKIRTTFSEALSLASDKFIETQYNNGLTEVVDIGVERYLCYLSPLYFM